MTLTAPIDRPYLGHGVGLRVPHYLRALEQGLDVDWVECITENFLGAGGRPLAVLDALRPQMPLVFHGVSLGIGAVDGPNLEYLKQIQQLFLRYDPAWVSDHLCWTHLDGKHSHDLLPLPYTEEALNVVVRNVTRVQDFLKRPLVLENVSSYVGFSVSQMSEAEFLREVATRADCYLLLDVNNVVVSAANHELDAESFIKNIPPERIWQLHLANHTDRGHYKFDSHKGAVSEQVWDLYEFTLRQVGKVSTLIEWDEEVPSWETLRAEQREAQRRAQRVLGDGPPQGARCD